MRYARTSDIIFYNKAWRETEYSHFFMPAKINPKIGLSYFSIKTASILATYKSNVN